MISLPIHAGSMTRDQYFCDISSSINIGYSYDNLNKGWIPFWSATPVAPGTMYWMSLQNGCSQKQVGIPLPNLYTAAYTGWNGMGSIYTNAVLTTNPPGKIRTIYGYNASSQLYFIASNTNIEPGRGYYVEVTEDCTLILTPHHYRLPGSFLERNLEPSGQSGRTGGQQTTGHF